jgi:predicted transcriptional regulator
MSRHEQPPEISDGACASGYERTRRPVFEAGRIARAQQSVAAGRVVPLEDVARWIASLGTDDVLPVPRAPR